MSISPLEQYQQRIDDQRITPDRYQERAVRALQSLYEDVIASEAKRSGNDGLLRRLRLLAMTDKGNENIKGVYLHGGVGRGKSMIMDMFFEALPDSLKKRRVHFHEFLIELHDGLHRRRGDGVEAILPDFAKEVARDARVLCFDEFHVTDVADAMILGRLFTALFSQGVIVVATSNWEPDRLYEGGLQRDLFLPFIKLLKERLDVIAMDGETDYRLETLQQDGVYFWPLGKPARQHADRAFKDLTEGAKTYKEILSVKGRDLKVRVVAKGVARFSFAELCERPMGAEDYLHIAQSYHTVFLEGIPRLGYDRRNETKRLMTLVDALYDRGTKLVVTAAASADKLYDGHDYAFEFDRTVSRLIEMQSKDYLERKL
ncbi:MAG: cell division protein ZapE [Rhodospirillales bacterium]|nr:cell division protein ZapE [Rhodospirillales bacterium]